MYCVRRHLPYTSNGHWNGVVPLIHRIICSFSNGGERRLKCCLHINRNEGCECQSLRQLVTVIHMWNITSVCCVGAVWLTEDPRRYTGRLTPQTVLSNTPFRSSHLWSVGLVDCFKKRKTCRNQYGSGHFSE